MNRKKNLQAGLHWWNSRPSDRTQSTSSFPKMRDLVFWVVGDGEYVLGAAPPFPAMAATIESPSSSSVCVCVLAGCCFELFRVLLCPCRFYTVRFEYLWSRDKWIGPREALPRVCFILGFYRRPIGLYNLKARHHFLNKIFNYIHNYTCISNL